MNPPASYFMHVSYPINQVLFSKSDTTYIYYPKRKEGFKFTSNYTNTTDVSKGLMPVFKDEYLTKLGMILVKSDYKKGKLIKYYSPSDSKSPLKFIKIVYKNHLIRKIEIINRDDKVIKRSVYGNYEKIDKKNIPMSIVNYSSTGKDSIVSEIKYDSLNFIENIPDSVQNYRIPKNIKLKEMKW